MQDQLIRLLERSQRGREREVMSLAGLSRASRSTPLLGSPLLDQGAQLIVGLHDHPAVYGLPSDWTEIGACTQNTPLVRRRSCDLRDIASAAAAPALPPTVLTGLQVLARSHTR